MLGDIYNKPEGYTVYSGILRIPAILNYSGPERYSNHEIYSDPWFDEDAYVAARNKIDDYYNKLEEHINDVGVLNPVCVNYAMRHPVYGEQSNNVPICWLTGGDILFAAKRVGFTHVPCIISDFGNNKKQDWNEIHTIAGLTSIITNPSIKPAIRFTQYGVQYPEMPFPEGLIDVSKINHFGSELNQDELAVILKQIVALENYERKLEERQLKLRMQDKLDKAKLKTRSETVIIPKNKNPDLMLRHPRQFETPEETEKRNAANDKAKSKALRLQAKASTIAIANNTKYIEEVYHTTWWEDKPKFVFVPTFYKPVVLTAPANETHEAMLIREDTNMRALGKADRKTLLERRKAIKDGLMTEADFPTYEDSKLVAPKAVAPVFGIRGVVSQATANRDSIPQEDISYDVVLKYLDPNTIFNYVGPWSFTQPAIRKKNVFPTEQEMVDKRNSMDSFYNKLEKSIAAQGVLDPIVINYQGGVNDFTINLIPANKKTVIKVRKIDESTGVEKLEDKIIVTPPICLYMGGSRLWVAQKLGLEKIPCIISDFSVNRSHLHDGEKLNSIKEIANKFKNKPRYLRYTKLGIKYEPGADD